MSRPIFHGDRLPGFIDLTLPLRKGMRGVSWEPATTAEREGWNTRTWSVYSHAGTHMDAQTHFAAGPETVDQIAIGRCAGRARVADLRRVGPRGLHSVEEVAGAVGTPGPEDVLLLATGWSRHAETPGLYRDGLPRVSVELAEWCADVRLKLLGVEPPSVADVNDRGELTKVHKILLGAGVVIVEGLTNLDLLLGRDAYFMALPVKAESGDGFPCRAVALIHPDDDREGDG